MGSSIENRSDTMLMHIMNKADESPSDKHKKSNNKVVQRNRKDAGHVITIPAIP